MAAPLVREILLKASRQGLEFAGAAALGPAWPLLRAALEPVLDRLTEKLGGVDPLSSEAAATRAADELDRDTRLQKLLQGALAEGLAPVLEGQRDLDANYRALAELTSNIEAQLIGGVTLAPGEADAIAEKTAERVAAMLDVRRFAVAELEAASVAPTAPDTWATTDDLADEVNRAEVEAVELIELGRVGEALENLQRARDRLAQALLETPTDVRLTLLHGYLLKATAQAHVRAGDEAAAMAVLRRAEVIFRLASLEGSLDAAPRDVVAGGLNGLGNVQAMQGRHAEAVVRYREALRLEPSYGYAWQDLLLSLVALAGQGDLRAEDLDEAWRGLRANAAGYPGLDEARLELLGGEYRRVRPDAGVIT